MPRPTRPAIPGPRPVDTTPRPASPARSTPAAPATPAVNRGWADASTSTGRARPVGDGFATTGPARSTGPTAPTPPPPAVPVTQIAGMAIRGLDLSSIDSGELTVKLPLRKGTFLVPTNHADARTRVSQDGFLEVKVKIEKGPDGQPMVQGVRLAFEPRVTVLNPASSLQPATGAMAGAWNWVQDVAGDIHMTAMDIGPDGEVKLEGVVDKPWPMKDQALQDAIPKGTFPKFDMRLSSIAGGTMVSEAAAPSANPGKAPSLEALLQSMGAMTGAGTFGLNLRTKETTLTADATGFVISSAKSKVELNIGGKVELDETGTLRLELPDDADKEFTSGLGTLDLAGQATAKVGKDGTLRAQMDVRTSTQLDGITGYVVREKAQRVPITINGADNVVVANTRVRLDEQGLTLENGGVKVKVRADLPEGATVDVEGNSVKLTGGDATAQSTFGFGMKDGKLSVSDGTVDMLVTGKDAELTRAGGGKIRLGVGASVRLTGQDIVLDPQTAKPTGTGQVTMGVNTSLGHKELGQLDYRLQADGSVAVKPKSANIGEIVLPLNELQRKSAVIVDPKGPAAGKVGSAEFKARITELTGAKVTTNNQVTLLTQGVDSQRERLSMINGAKKAIALQTYIFKDDASGNETADALIAAAQRGVKVRVVIDGIGNVTGPDALTDENAIYARLKAGGVDLRVHTDPKEHAIGDIMLELKNNPELPRVDDPSALMKDPARAAAVLQDLAQIATGAKPVSPETRKRVSELLEKVSAGAGDQPASISAERLAAIAGGDPVTVKEVTIALRHLSELNFRWHEKYLVVDGGTAITGGMNIADEYMLGGSGKPWAGPNGPMEAWRDADVKLAGDAAGEVHQAFARNWETLTGEKLAAPKAGPVRTGEEVQFIQGHPRQNGDRHITNASIEALKALGPGDKAYIANAYFLPTGSLDALKVALMEAAKRGVDVRVITNSEGSTDLAALNWAAYHPVEELLGAGVRIFERSVASTLHTKAAVYGSELSVVGSFNMDNRSASLNSEGVALSYGKGTGKSVEDMILKDMAPEVARELDVATVQARIKAAGSKGAAAVLFGDLM